MFDIHKIKIVLKKAFTPVTIMLIPHSNTKPFNLKVPSIGVFISIILWFIGTVYVFSVAVDTFEYHDMKRKLNYYSQQFLEVDSTISALKKAENEFKKLFSLGSKEKIIENVDTSDSGSIDIENLKEQIKKTMETVGEIKDYLRLQKDIYLATPMGLPVAGNITSSYGKREHPRSGKEDLHTGLDISSGSGSPVRSTADGIVSFSGWSGGSGNFVVLEHGFGFSTCYAHNKMNTVRVGQKVNRGDVIGYVGSTGNTTGPHVHYEVWKDGRSVNPHAYIKGRS
ncbi:MAG: M23 family metallopeptidase [Nitrospirota bacterium]|nr:M23 family metallopeptidase [Nitrospirota bacterium]MDH5768468.1 M23 family metallopeptidase [Nitrospirota bacterium]